MDTPIKDAITTISVRQSTKDALIKHRDYLALGLNWDRYLLLLINDSYEDKPVINPIINDKEDSNTIYLE